MKINLAGIIISVFLGIIMLNLSGEELYDVKDIQQDSILVLQILNQLHHRKNADMPFLKADSLLIAKAITISKSRNYIEEEVKCYDLIGVQERNRANYAMALFYHKKALELLGDKSTARLKAVVLNNIGVVYRRLDNFTDAIQYHLQALAISEQINDTPNICVSLNSLGNIFMAQKKSETALRYFEQALSKETSSGNLLGMAINYNNIGGIYLEKKKYSMALEFMNKSLDCNRKLNNQKGMAICFNDLGNICFEQNQYNEALNYYNKALLINSTIEDKIYIAETFINIGKVKRFTFNFDESLSDLNKGLRIALSIGSVNNAITAFKELSNTYESIGDASKALVNYKKYVQFKDSLLTLEVDNSVNRMQVLYETGKKDKEIEFLKDKDLINSKKHKIVVSILISGCILLFVFLVLIYMNYRLKQKVNNALLNYNRDVDEKNRLLTNQKEEILTQRNDIEIKSNQINRAFELIKIKNNNITENIRYAFQIQSSLLPEFGVIKSILKDAFLFYKPKDIVSGDFYWVTEKNGLVVLVVGDCTGHGVSGAFMSILGITALNEIVIEKGVTETDEILNLMRDKIIWTLQQGGEFSETRDGIHMVVCTLDKMKKTLQFSGAMNSVMIVRQQKIQLYKGDKMPVSIYPDMRKFTAITIPLESRDMIYLYTDGYYGQFGGSDDRKFSVIRFRDLLKLLSPLAMDKQQKQLENVFASWMGDAEQVDDILIMGVKID